MNTQKRVFKFNFSLFMTDLAMLMLLFSSLTIACFIHTVPAQVIIYACITASVATLWFVMRVVLSLLGY